MPASARINAADYARDLLSAEAPLDERIRALYRLKEAARCGDPESLSAAAMRRREAADILILAIDTTSSVLLQNELIYNIGQFGCTAALDALMRVAGDRERYGVVSRHEAIEAMGAIGDGAALPFLNALVRERMGDGASEGRERPRDDPIVESAVLAVQRIEEAVSSARESLKPPPHCPFVSVDPAPAFPEEAFEAKDRIAKLSEILRDASVSLWDRYRAMFSLRNIGTARAVDALCEALRGDRTSSLFRHEVAFVLGQLESPHAQRALADSLRDETEHPMVRHEAAEAIGAIAEDATWPLLEEYSRHREPIVRDSCVVALDMHRYWQQFKTPAKGMSREMGAGRATS